MEDEVLRIRQNHRRRESDVLGELGRDRERFEVDQHRCDAESGDSGNEKRYEPLTWNTGEGPAARTGCVTESDNRRPL